MHWKEVATADLRRLSALRKAAESLAERKKMIAALTRMSDKWNRLENLMLHGDPSVCGEGVTDTLLDLANYCLMTVIAITESEEKMTKWHTGKPTDEGEYLASIRENKTYPHGFAEVEIADYIGDGKWWISGYDTDCVVDAWMPLPDPYNPGVNDGDSN